MTGWLRFSYGARMRRPAALAAAALVATGVAACGSSSTTTGASGTTVPAGGGGASLPSLVIGSQNFPENEVLAYVYADALKAAGDKDVTVKANLGSREVTGPALASGSIDLIPEYLGNYLTFIDPSAGVLTVAATYSTLKPLAAQKGLTVAAYSQAADSDAVAVTQDNATKYGLHTIADLSKVASQWTFGGPPECQTRITCYAGLSQYYGLHFKGFKALDEDGPLTLSALKGGDVEAARIFSSDSTIASDHLVVLADPKDFQGAGNIVPIVRSAKSSPALLAVLDKVSAALTTADLVSFNTQTGTNHDDPQTVAQQFVSAHGL